MGSRTRRDGTQRVTKLGDEERIGSGCIRHPRTAKSPAISTPRRLLHSFRARNSLEASQTSMLTRRAIIALIIPLMACSPSSDGGGSDSGGDGPLPGIGPEGGILDFDAAEIPAPWEVDSSAGTSPGEDGEAAADEDSGAAPEEGGPSPVEAASPSCTGTPTACSLAAACDSVQGCASGGTCTGVAEGCYSQFSDFSCISLQGCVWSTSTNSCTGLSWSCNLFSGATSCVTQTGCNWALTCGGTPTPCDLIPAVSCASQPGCFLQ